MSTVLNVTTAPRDRELLIKANRFTLRILAEQLKLYDPADTTQRNAWLKYTIEEQAERVLAALLKLDKKGGKSSEPERTPVHKKGKKAPPPDEDEDEEEEEEEEEDEEEDGEEVDEDEEKPPVRKPTKGKPAKKDEEDEEDAEDEEEDEEDEEEEPARKPVKGKTAERSPVNKGTPARTPAKPATAAAPGKPAEALLEALEEIKQRLDIIEEQFRISHSFQGLAISMLSAVGGSVLDETALYEASLEGFDKATQRIKDVQVATKKTRKAPKGK